jgi:ribosome-binding factor A
MANPRTIARIASRIQQRVAYCLQFEIKDPRAAFVTLTKVEVAQDLRSAKVYWSTLGGPAERSRTEHMLEHAGGFIRRQLGRVLETRLIPELRWIYDGSIEKSAEVDLLIRGAMARDEAIRAAAGRHEHGADEHGADEHGAHEHGSDEHGPDGRGPDGQGPGPLDAPA